MISYNEQDLRNTATLSAAQSTAEQSSQFWMSQTGNVSLGKNVSTLPLTATGSSPKVKPARQPKK
jgi:hypothetical protein